MEFFDSSSDIENKLKILPKLASQKTPKEDDESIKKYGQRSKKEVLSSNLSSSTSSYSSSTSNYD
jgi:hypothetical protein